MENGFILAPDKKLKINMASVRKSMLEIKEYYDTDKNEKYLNNYEKYFSHLRDKDIKLLELGVFKGGSLLLWADYFEKGVIAGVDINDVDVTQSERLHFFKGGQSDGPFINGIAEKLAPEGFDIIIDDASHYGAFTKQSFNILFEKLLKPGGIYVIEDWGTGYWKNWPDGAEFQPPVDTETDFPSHHKGMVGVVKQLIDDLAVSDITHETFGSPPARSSWIKEMSIYTGQVFLVKAK
jgi:SAM-dependent methyltransferase